jgi:uncharacterized membrane protein
VSDLGPGLLEATWVLIGVMLGVTGIRAFLDHSNPRRVTTSAFWLLLGCTFALGSVLPDWVIGIVLLVIAALSFARGVKTGTFEEGTTEEREGYAHRLGNWLFIPALSLAAIAIGISTWAPFGDQSGSLAIAIASVAALLIAWVLTRARPGRVVAQSDRMIQQVGPVGMLPQFLAMLGAVFTSAGVGEVVADAIAKVVPDGNQLAGVIAYCAGMALFTIIVGNTFAAFTVITTGIGIPFVIALGGDPVIAGAIGMTAGFCGTLVTPMAANFNALPVGLLEMKDTYGVIKAQAPLALILFVIQVVLMYLWAF